MLRLVCKRDINKAEIVGMILTDAIDHLALNWPMAIQIFTPIIGRWALFRALLSAILNVIYTICRFSS